MTRPTWDEYFLELVDVVAKRSTCRRRHVGAIIVKDKRILSTGYNGAPSGLKHCIDGECIREKNNVPSGERHELCRGIHAEMNAIVQAAAYGISVKDSVLYVTNHPCSLCAKMIINCNIRKIIIKDSYPDELAGNMLKEAGVEIVNFDEIKK